MSASREKKQRQSNPKSLRGKIEQIKQMDARSRVNIRVAVFSTIICIILLVVNGIIFKSNPPAAAVSSRTYRHEFSVEEVTFYYQLALNEEYSFYSQYAAFGVEMPFDPSSPLSEQIQDEESGKTWQQYFQDAALQQLMETHALCDAAQADSYTISDEAQSYIDQTLKTLDNTAAQNGIDRATVISRTYGISAKTYLSCLNDYTLAMDYENHHLNSLTYDTAALDAYYAEHSADLDSYDFRYFYVNGSAPAPTDENGDPLTDEDGNAVTATEAEQAAAMEAAKANADKAVASIEAADDKAQTMISSAPDYVSESSRDSYAQDEDATLSTGLIGSQLDSMVPEFSSWLKDDARTAGDVTAIEGGSGYYVVLFLNRYLVEDATVNYSDILITAELDQADNADTADVDESTVPSQASMDTAKASCESLLTQWQAGDATVESFAALGSDDVTVNQYTFVQKDQRGEELNAWLFDPARKSGDTIILEDSSGYRLVCFGAVEALYWHYNAKIALQNADQSAWLEQVKDGYVVTPGKKLSRVGS